MKKILSVLCILIFLISSCDRNEVAPEAKDGEVQFTVSLDDLNNLSNGRISEEVLQSGFITIEIMNEKGEYTTVGFYGFEKLDYNQKPYEKDKYITETFLLAPGKYTIEYFAIINPDYEEYPDDELLYAIPRKGSDLAYLVEQPLPVTIHIEANKLTTTPLELINVGSTSRGEYGYDVSIFELVELADMGFVTYTYDSEAEKLIEIGATATFYDDQGNKLFDRFFPAGVSYIKMRTDLSPIDMHSVTVEKAGYISKTVEFFPMEHFAQDGFNPISVTLTKE